MDFRSINKFNVVMNAMSGNFLPTTEDKSALGYVRMSYLVFTWIVEGLYLLSTTIGLLFFVPPIVAARDGGISFVVGFEVLILFSYLTSRRERLCDLVGRINGVLVNTDDLKRCIRDTVGPHKKRLKIYSLATIASVVLWAAQPLPKILQRDERSFTYTDFVLPTYYPGAPFNTIAFVWGVVFQMAGAGYLIFKKSAIDIYISYYITLLTAEHRYVHRQISDILGADDNNHVTNKSVIASLQKCVQHHCMVIETGKMFSELLNVNVGVTYANCIARFCCVGFSCVTAATLIERAVYIMYFVGTAVQVFMLCMCAQELLDASTAITDGGFHEDWYSRGNTVMTTFLIMGMGDKMKCRLSAFGIVDLTVPTFSSIVNQAYTICLLLLRVY